MKRTLQFKRDNTLKQAIPNRPGLYKFYSKSGKLLYVGHAKNLRHRVQSYRQVDCLHTHPTKKNLRPRIHKFQIITMPEKKARTIEKKIKARATYNIW